MPHEITTLANLEKYFAAMVPNTAKCDPDTPESAVVTANVARLVTASDLFNSKLVPARPLIDQLLWNGLTMLIARPKAGKSWLTLQLAVLIAGGREISGFRAIETGQVLYAALEEPMQRTSGRIRKVTESGPWADNIRFLYELPPLMSGGAEVLSAYIEKVRPRLVVIDTLTALIGSGFRRSTDVFRSQYAEVSCVRKIAEQHQTAIILVHHERKGQSDGPVEAVAGTGGISAAVDALWLLHRRPGGDAVLNIVGREMDERSWALRFQNQPVGWKLLGDGIEHVLKAERREIIELLRDEGPRTPAEIARNLGKQCPAIRQMLKRMIDGEQVTRDKYGKYAVHPSLSFSHEVTDSENE